MPHRIAEYAANSPWVGSILATSTTTVGAVQWFGWIPDDIGKFASLAGIVATLCGAALSLVLVYVHLKKLKGGDK